MKEVAEETLEELMPALLQEKEKEQEVVEWLLEESVCCNSDSSLLPNPSKWKMEYLKTLQLYYSLRSSCEVDKHMDGCLIRLEKKLSDIEKAYSLNQRWLPSDHEYTENQKAIVRQKEEQILLEAAVFTEAQREICRL